MATIAVVYDTKYGQTKKIAEYAAKIARDRGHIAHVMPVGASGAFSRVDGTVVLSPVFLGKHTEAIRVFVAKDLRRLQAHRGAFFSVSGQAGSSDSADRAAAQARAVAFVKGTGWSPQIVASFGGAMAYPRYNPFLRFFCKFMAKRNGGPTDTSRVHEFTDWTAVERTMLELLAPLERTRTSAKSFEAAIEGTP